jgi:hypothetical protein
MARVPLPKIKKMIICSSAAVAGKEDQSSGEKSAIAKPPPIQPI